MFKYSNIQYSIFNIRVERVKNTVNYDYGYNENIHFSSNRFWIFIFFICMSEYMTLLHVNILKKNIYKYKWFLGAMHGPVQFLYVGCFMVNKVYGIVQLYQNRKPFSGQNYWIRSKSARHADWVLSWNSDLHPWFLY